MFFIFIAENHKQVQLFVFIVCRYLYDGDSSYCFPTGRPSSIQLDSRERRADGFSARQKSPSPFLPPCSRKRKEKKRTRVNEAPALSVCRLICNDGDGMIPHAMARDKTPIRVEKS